MKYNNNITATNKLGLLGQSEARPIDDINHIKKKKKKKNNNKKQNKNTLNIS